MLPRIINLILGLWLMAAPAVLGYGGAARGNDRIAGPLSVSCAIIAAWEITRALRILNAVVAIWLLIAPWLLAFSGIEILNSTLVGFLLLGCALARGYVRHSFGGGWRSLWERAFAAHQLMTNEVKYAAQPFAVHDARHTGLLY